jgi:two-component system, OmpR family, sensor kinase
MVSFIGRFFSPRSLKYQLLSRSFIILSVLLILIGVLQYAFMNNFLYRNEAQSIETRIATTPKWVWQNLSADGTVPDRSTLFDLETPGATIAFINPDGRFVDIFEDNDHDGQNDTSDQDSDDLKALQLSQPAYQQALTSRTDMTYELTRDNAGNKTLVVLHRIGDPNHPVGLVQVTTPTKLLHDILIKELTIFGFLVIGGLIAGLMTFLSILRRTLVPLSRMVQTVSRINAGNLDERFSTTHAQQEIELLASSFNDMLERLETSFEAERIAKERMRQFIADASHELRTPLTSIHGFLEVLLRGAAADPVKLDKALNSMYGESERVNKLVQDLLYLARLDHEPSFVFTAERLDILFQEMESQLRLLAGDRNVAFSFSEDITVNCDSDKIKQVLLNLFQNAVQHTDPKTGEIQVSLTRDFAGARISVHDNGVGIPPEHRVQLFQRFYRVDSARSRKNGGVGLGLSITKSIVDHHGGTIHFESSLDEGTRFNVWLPIQVN